MKIKGIKLHEVEAGDVIKWESYAKHHKDTTGKIIAVVYSIDKEFGKDRLKCLTLYDNRQCWCGTMIDRPKMFQSHTVYITEPKDATLIAKRKELNGFYVTDWID